MEQLVDGEQKEIAGQLYGDKVNVRVDSENCRKYSQDLPI